MKKLILIFVSANLLRVLCFHFLPNWLYISSVTFIAFLLFGLIVFVVIRGVKSFDFIKPLIAVLTLVSFLCFPLKPLYIGANYYFYKDLREEFIESVESGEIELSEKGERFVFSDDTSQKFKNVSKENYVIRYKDEYRFIVFKSPLGDYEAIFYGDIRDAIDIKDKKKICDDRYYIKSE